MVRGGLWVLFWDLWGPPGIIFCVSEGPGGGLQGALVAIWGLWGLLDHFLLVGYVSVLSAPGKVSISPQRGAIFQHRHFCKISDVSRKWPPLWPKWAYRRTGATYFDGRMFFEFFCPRPILG